MLLLIYKTVTYMPVETYTMQAPSIIVTAQTYPDKSGATQPIVTPEPIDSLPLPSGSDGSFKAMERVEKITREGSKQWHLKQIYTLDEDGFCRIGEYYAVAMGTYYAKYIGQTLEIQFDSRTIKVIIGDVKADEHTIDKMYCSTNGSIVEFIVKENTITSDELQELFKGKIVSIRYCA